MALNIINSRQNCGDVPATWRNETERMRIVNKSVFIFYWSHEPAQHSPCSPSDRLPSSVPAAPFKSQAHCETKPR